MVSEASALAQAGKKRKFSVFYPSAKVVNCIKLEVQGHVFSISEADMNEHCDVWQLSFDNHSTKIPGEGSPLACSNCPHKLDDLEISIWGVGAFQHWLMCQKTRCPTEKCPYCDDPNEENKSRSLRTTVELYYLASFLNCVKLRDDAITYLFYTYQDSGNGVPTRTFLKLLYELSDQLCELDYFCFDILCKRKAQTLKLFEDDRDNLPEGAIYDLCKALLKNKEDKPLALSTYHLHEQDADYCSCKRPSPGPAFFINE